MFRATKRVLRSVLREAGVGNSGKPIVPDLNFPDATAADISLMDAVVGYTMTSRARQWALIKAVRYVDAHRIPGDIVECGVWRGGSMMLAKMARVDASEPRRYHLFDTYAGMTRPLDVDVSTSGEVAADKHAKRERDGYNSWCYASRDDVEQNLKAVGLSDQEMRLIEGPVEHTLLDPANIPRAIGILRLDTDWYESTKIEMNLLYPRLSLGGVLILDDYGHWVGARKAVDEYFGDKPPLLVPVDPSCRICIKTEAHSPAG